MKLKNNTELQTISYALDSFFNNFGRAQIVCDRNRFTEDKFEHSARSFEDDNQYRIEVSLPGYAKNEINLSSDSKYLTLESNLDDKKKKEYNLLNESPFKRVFKVPKDCDHTKITAKLEHGILHVILSKKKLPKPKQIRIS
jgi:HSP20 family protein